MKILVDASVLQLDLTGVGRALLGLWGAAARIESDIRVCAVHQQDLRCVVPNGVVTKRITAGNAHPALWRHLALRAYAITNEFDVVHFPWNTGVIRPRKHCRVILTVHDVIPLVLPERYFFSERELKRFRETLQFNVDHADLVLTDSHTSKADIAEHLSLKREPLVVYPAATLKVAPTAPKWRDGNLHLQNGYFVYVGGFDGRKGLDQLIRVYADLFVRQKVSVPLVVVGKRRVLGEEFEQQLDRAQTVGAVHLTGYVDDPELAALLAGARALIYPSLYEGFGYPPLEAMSLGCPVLTSGAGAIREVCSDAALYFERADDQLLADGIVSLCEDAALRAQMSGRGLVRSRCFSWDASAKCFLAALSELRVN